MGIGNKNQQIDGLFPFHDSCRLFEEIWPNNIHINPSSSLVPFRARARIPALFLPFLLEMVIAQHQCRVLGGNLANHKINVVPFPFSNFCSLASLPFCLSRNNGWQNKWCCGVS
jgi:hypothetical protein